MLVGLGIQFSTLGVNLLIINYWGISALNKAAKEFFFISLLWSLSTSTVAVTILSLLISLVKVTFHSQFDSHGIHDGLPTETKGDEEIKALEELTFLLESRYVVGSISGLCLAWTFTDALLGMKWQMVTSLVTLFGSLSWCHFVMKQIIKGKEKSEEHEKRSVTISAV